MTKAAAISQREGARNAVVSVVALPAVDTMFIYFLVHSHDCIMLLWRAAVNILWSVDTMLMRRRAV